MQNAVREEIKKVKDYILKNDRSEISLESAERQLNLFVNGVSIPRLEKPCTIGDGIIQFNENDFDNLLVFFKSSALNGRLMKFVPASGAASRMFQKPQSVLNRAADFSFNDLKNKSADDKECKSVLELLNNLTKFAFYDELKNVLNVDDEEIDKLVQDAPVKILKAILFDEGLNYLSKPKGAIKFHRYRDDSRTAFEEQVYEVLHFIVDKKNNVKVHFTISEEHEKLFSEIIDQLNSKLSNTDFKVNVTYSFQKNITSTIAVDLDNKVLFDKNGNLVLRPGGHGALLENLNDLEADIAVIKNIDNVAKEGYSEEAILYKKLLIGYLVKIQNQVFDLLKSLDKEDLNERNFDEIMKFAEQILLIDKPIDFKYWDLKRKNKFLFDKLNRPIRICGMVKNEGEPGGGPFWVKSIDGNLSLQIIEKPQINKDDENQKNIFKQSTHFNPVDLVCGLRNYKGKNFNLLQFRDLESGIITKKFKDGVELKALELPGLWNGSMAYWNTLFVEVPTSTFNPVKEVNDLLRAAHQS
jgi:hypothetical protein